MRCFNESHTSFIFLLFGYFFVDFFEVRFFILFASLFLLGGFFLYLHHAMRYRLQWLISMNDAALPVRVIPAAIKKTWYQHSISWHRDRRDYFESPQDTWEMIKLILEERKRREVDPTLQVLEACLAECETADDRVRERLENMHALFQTMDSWYREVMSLSDKDLKRLLGMSRQVRKLLRFRS